MNTYPYLNISFHHFPDRYWSITSPLRYLRKRTKKRALIMITMAWIGASMWFIPVLGWNQILRRGKSQLPGNFLHFFLPESKNAFFGIVRQFCTLRNWKSKKNFIRKLFVYIFELFYFLQKMQTTFDICALYKLLEIGKRSVFIELKNFPWTCKTTRLWKMETLKKVKKVDLLSLKCL